jgi:hypothetical protein
VRPVGSSFPHTRLPHQIDREIDPPLDLAPANEVARGAHRFLGGNHRWLGLPIPQPEQGQSCRIENAAGITGVFVWHGKEKNLKSGINHVDFAR